MKIMQHKWLVIAWRLVVAWRNVVATTLLLLPFTANAAENNIVNVYAWTSEVPDFVVRRFEKETGIKVNFSTYENNEIMYAKIRTSKNAGYDLIMPSSYFVDRMARQHLIQNWINPDSLT